MELLLEHLGKGFMTMLMLSMPVVLTAAGIGLVVGILQAVTQVQEQTISAAPKILGVFLLIIIMGNFYTRKLTDYFREGANLAFNVITKSENYVLEPYQHLQGNEPDKSGRQIKRPSIDYLMKNPDKIPYSDKKSKFSTQKTTVPMVNPNFVEKNKMYNNR